MCVRHFYTSTNISKIAFLINRLSTLLAHWLSVHTYNCITYLREETLLQSDIPNHSYTTPLIFALSG
nr:MAG TPA: hypothetical protein [Caudoviricetes sp.]DAU13862.1 MAG TPA: hypothetical protein [Bacteriophage sp.]